MILFILTSDDYNECDNGCYIETIEEVFLSREAAEQYAKDRFYRKHHYTIHEKKVIEG